MSRRIGYARASTSDQELTLQFDALRSAGVDEHLIFADRMCGAKADQAGLDYCLKELKSGDTLIVWRIDRLGRSISHRVGIIEDLRARHIGFKSLCNGAFDTTTASGELVFNIFSSLSQFERRILQERVRVRLETARSRGRKGGRRPVTSSDPRVKAAKKMSANREMSIKEICKTLRVSKATYYRFLSMNDG